MMRNGHLLMMAELLPEAIGEIRPKECDKGTNNKMKNARDQFQIDISGIKYKSKRGSQLSF